MFTKAIGVYCIPVHAPIPEVDFFIFVTWAKARKILKD
jgi:hypothetical protein